MNCPSPFKKLVAFSAIVTLFSPFFLHISHAFIEQADATAQPNVTISASPNAANVTITATFSESIPAGNITDIEVYNSSNQKVFQQFPTSGGTTFQVTTPNLPNGAYSVSVGLFTPNWGSNYAWFGNIAHFTLPYAAVTPTPTPTVAPTAAASNTSSVAQAAMTAYTDWKAKYVRSVESGVSRVVRPENNNDTVSEGIGYGMLLAVWGNDAGTFDALWNYGKKYLDGKGLMNWQIASDGKVIGTGSATDADEDMAYALILAHKKWSGKGYDTGAKNLITAMLANEVMGSNHMTPGDGWGTTTIVNPSYLAPSYYRAFANFTGNSRWNDIANTNSAWLMQVADSNTGLVPDWKNSDLSDANVSFDQYKNDFYYDAVRTPIRMLHAVKTTADTNAQFLLKKQHTFFSGIGATKLKAGYKLSGTPLTDYLDTTFIAGYAAAGQIDPSSVYGKASLQQLISDNPSGYFGASLRAVTLFIIAGGGI